MEGKPMRHYDERAVSSGRRRSRRRARKKGWLRWLCNPLVAKEVIAIARMIVELATIFWRH
jgi:hypothetical protein